MRIRIARRALFSLMLLALGGFFGGFVGGLLGAGGGIIITLALSRLLPRDESGRRAVFACSLSVTLPLSLLTLVRYALSGELSLSLPSSSDPLSFAPVLIGAIFGGALGGFLLGKLRSRLLGRIFALLCAVSGLIMML